MITMIRLLPLLLIAGCATEAGIYSGKDFCVGLCSLTNDPVKVYESAPEPVKIEPLELTIQVAPAKAAEDKCSKEYPEFCLD